MAKKRKLQVFVSSTFTDLKEERQAAVEAILNTGHIPAGMELFAGQNIEQMNIIKEWIEESDIYMLLLGGRYGSIEPISEKSYTHLEYEHAQSLGKPVFAVIASDLYINQKATANGKPDGIIELDFRNLYSDFKREITGRFVKFWDNQDQLKLAIATTLHVLERDESLVGWIPGNEVTDTVPLVEELSRFAKENERLRSENNKLKDDSLSSSSSSADDNFNGLDFPNAVQYLSNYLIDPDLISKEYLDALNRIKREIYVSEEPNVIHFLLLWYLYNSSTSIHINKKHKLNMNTFKPLLEVGLIKMIQIEESTATHTVTNIIQITPQGRSFLLRSKSRSNIFQLEHIAVILREKVGNNFLPFSSSR